MNKSKDAEFVKLENSTAKFNNFKHNHYYSVSTFRNQSNRISCSTITNTLQTQKL